MRKMSFCRETFGQFGCKKFIFCGHWKKSSNHEKPPQLPSKIKSPLNTKKEMTPHFEGGGGYSGIYWVFL
jgi:hypothetical protein